MPKLRKITAKPSRLADRVYDRLMGAILDGTISQGDRLIQEKLAEDLAVSRTPVREALLRLEREGIIEQAGRKGFVVRTVSKEMIQAIYQAREAVEGYAARLVAEQADEEAIDQLAERIARLGPAANVESSYEANRLAHRAIVEATGNEYLVELFDSIWGRTISVKIFADLWVSQEIHRPVTDLHAEVLDALRSGDGERAAKVMIEHIRQGLDQQLEVLERGS